MAEVTRAISQQVAKNQIELQLQLESNERLAAQQLEIQQQIEAARNNPQIQELQQLKEYLAEDVRPADQVQY